MIRYAEIHLFCIRISISIDKILLGLLLLLLVVEVVLVVVLLVVVVVVVVLELKLLLLLLLLFLLLELLVLLVVVVAMMEGLTTAQRAPAIAAPVLLGWLEVVMVLILLHLLLL